jgi:hypothetical protein
MILHLLFTFGCPEGRSPIKNEALRWQVLTRPEVNNEVIEIAEWYDSRSEGLGDRFIEDESESVANR